MPLPVLEGVLRVMPRLLVLTAPGGYGKTTAALEYANVFRSSAAIDLARTQNERALLLELLNVSLADGGDRAYLEQAQLSLAVDQEVPPPLAERVLDVWRDPGAPAAVVFDNAERLPGDLVPLFNRILTRRPGHRACVVCSGTPVPLDHSQIASQAETVSVRATDLALSPEQVHALFAETGIPERQLRAVIDVAAGWPLLTLLLRHLYAEGRLEAALSHAADSANAGDVYPFVQSQVVDMLPAVQRRAIEFCASVPDARIDDVQRSLGWPAAEALRAAARTLPLIRIRGDRVEVHSLIAAAMARQNANAVDDLRMAARTALRRGDRNAASERYIACGDREEAAQVLEDVLEHGATAAVANVASSLDEEILERHPRWFALTALLRRYDVPPAENLANIQAQRARVEQTVDVIARFTMSVLETHQLLHCGFPGQARERIADLDVLVQELKRGGIANALRAHVATRIVDTLRAAILVIDGNAGEAERLLKRGRLAIGQFALITVSAAVDSWLPIGLLRGDLRLIREQFTRAGESLSRAGLDIVRIDLDMNEAFAGWLLDDDAMYARSIARVDERARIYRTHAFDHFLGCVGLRPECAQTGVEPLRRLVIAHLLGAARARGELGLQHAENARRVAQELHQPLFVALAALAVRERGGDPGADAGALALTPALEAAFVARMRRGN